MLCQFVTKRKHCLCFSNWSVQHPQKDKVICLTVTWYRCQVTSTVQLSPQVTESKTKKVNRKGSTSSTSSSSSSSVVDPLSSVLDGTDPLSMFAATSDPAASGTVTVSSNSWPAAGLWVSSPYLQGWWFEGPQIMPWGILVVTVQDIFIPTGF